MGWGEALRLARILSADPSSQVGAALAGFDRPVDWPEIRLLHLIDSSEANRLGKKFKPVPKPWPDKDVKRYGTESLSIEELNRRLGRT